MAISVFEIIGPIMIGPSSSHTAGMVRIGMMANRIINEKATAIHLELSPKLRTTYFGHRSDSGLFGGAMGMCESDADIKNAISIAHERGIDTSVDFLPEGEYPQNSARVIITNEEGKTFSVTGTSVGGGSIIISEVDKVPFTLAADAYHIVLWSDNELKIDTSQLEVELQKGKNANGIHITCITFLEKPEEQFIRQLQNAGGVSKISLVEPVLAYGVSRKNVKIYKSCQEACEEAAGEKVTLAELAIRYEMERSGFSRELIVNRMYEQLEQMKVSVGLGQKENKLLYGLTSGKDGKLLMDVVNQGKTISGGIIPKAVAMALGVMEYNGSMGCIVAAPTAGSSGIVPGSIVALQDTYHISDEKLVDALFTSALMGIIMAERDVSFSGSVGGCQGEIGVSSSIMAAGIASIFSDDSHKVVHAMALCLKNLLGLVCDPIAAPIEVPCIKRNAVGVANAFISADMALAGIESFIPPDEVIDALVDVEKRLPSELKCATVGGLACTHTAKCVRNRLQSTAR